MIEVLWSEFKVMISNNIKWIYTLENSNYVVYGSFGSIDIKCLLRADSEEFLEFDTSYKSKVPKLYDIDAEGRQITRLAYAESGRSYLAHPLEFETSTFGSIVNKDFNNTDRGSCTCSFYNSNNELVTDSQYESTIVKTVVLFKPPYDYEMIAGSVRQIVKPTTDVRLWVIGGVIELGAVKEFSGGLNLQYIGCDEELKTDGRSSKYMAKDVVGVPYQANQIQIIVRHDAGLKHKIMIILEYYRD